MLVRHPVYIHAESVTKGFFEDPPFWKIGIYCDGELLAVAGSYPLLDGNAEREFDSIDLPVHAERYKPNPTGWLK